MQQLFLGQENDRLLDDLKLGHIPLHHIRLGISFPQGPVKEPFQEAIMLLNGFVFEAFFPQKSNILVDACFITK